MSFAQHVRYAEGNVLRVTEDELRDVWGSHVIDLDSIQLAIFRCPVGGEECQGCPEGDCWCSCDYSELWESAINVDGWEPPSCASCGEPAHLVAYVSTWGEVKGNRPLVA
jgi:hypothetical protein